MKNKKIKEKTRKNRKYAWVSLALALFCWVPLVNIILLPFSIYFGAMAMILSKKEPEKYSGFFIALFSVIISSVCFAGTFIYWFLRLSGGI